MRYWTKEERKKQSQLIKEHKPWIKSTGPKTAEGKNVSKMNAFKHGTRCEELRDILHDIAESNRELKRLNSMIL